MAKFQGFIGSGRGKAGNLVFSKGENGETIARAYQPQVKNPRTEAQILQRAKMNVVGQFSGMSSANLLAPLGMGSARKNRSEFCRHLLGVTSSEMVNGNAIAKFAPADVKFSKGFEPIRTTLEVGTLTANTLTLTVTPVNFPSDLLDVYGERYVVGVLDNSTNSLYDSIGYLDHIVTSDAAQTVTFNFNQPLQVGQTVIVWRMSYRLVSTGSALFGQDIHFDDTKVTAVMATNAMSSVAYWGATVLADTRPFVAGA